MDDQRVRQATCRILDDPVLTRLKAALAEASVPSLYLVGGTLRDAWLGLPTKDFDFVVPGDADHAGDVAKRIAAVLDARYVLLDEDWDMARLVWTPPEPPQARLLLDFAPMRGRDIGEDLLHRDFTCNAMAMKIGPDSGMEAPGWEDPTGGLSDLQAALIRMVHPARLREDPLRLVRAFRLACSLDFRIDRATLDAIHTARGGIVGVAGERVKDELFKIFACPHGYAWLRQMDETGLLTTLFPELQGLKGLKQGSFHHLDGWNHTMETYRILEEGLAKGFDPLAKWTENLQKWIDGQKDIFPLLKAAALFHDVGKPGACSVDAAGKPHFYRHEVKGAEIVSQAMRRLRAGRHDEERVSKWVRYHMGPIHMMRAMESGRLTETAKIRFLRRLGNEAPGVLLISLADFLATGGPAATGTRNASFYGLLDSLFELFFRKDAASLGGRHLVTGTDLIAALGISPGPVVGRLLRLLEEARIEGKVANRAEAIRLARSLLPRMSPENTRKHKGGAGPGESSDGS